MTDKVITTKVIGIHTRLRNLNIFSGYVNPPELLCQGNKLANSALLWMTS